MSPAMLLRTGWEIIKGLGLIFAAWMLICMGTHQVCGSDVAGICSFMCDSDESEEVEGE